MLRAGREQISFNIYISLIIIKLYLPWWISSIYNKYIWTHIYFVQVNKCAHTLLNKVHIIIAETRNEDKSDGNDFMTILETAMKTNNHTMYIPK